MILFLAVAALPGVPFGALQRTSLLIALLAGVGLFFVALGLVRRRGGEAETESSTTLSCAGAALMTLAAGYAVLINETVRWARGTSP